MKQLSKIMLLFIFLALLFNNCGLRTKSFIYHEPSIKKQEITANRIAIVPNRLPLNLTNPEKWRYYNWKIASDYLRNKGYKVVDYNTSVEAFNKSGLRVEDSKRSRDKYAVLSQQLGVDIIVIPYYGTMMSASTSLFWTKMQWSSVATFQFYSAEKNDFITRLDMSGTKTYTSGIFALLGTGISFAEPTAGLITIGLGTIIDLANTVFKSNNSQWRGVFKKAIKNGLEPFVETYPPRGFQPFSLIDSNQKSLNERKPTEEIIEGIRTRILNKRKGYLLINKGSDSGISIGQRCVIYTEDSGSGKYFKIGTGKIFKIKNNRAVVKVLTGKRIQKGDLCVVIK